ncbi:MAG: Uma2 family endonuclease [Acidimicrobiia bacterium]|nr:Uma2 family endonuclease [Acidimicrobiia bacterium]
MPATAAPPEQRVILENVSWETYERLLAENVESVGTRFTYDGGLLEIMVVGVGHEDPNRTLAALAEIVAEETRKDFRRTGSTTFKRRDLGKGFEPDSCYYFQNAPRVRGKDDLDLNEDPPPDLVIEVDITRSSLNRFPIFGAVGVPEVWRYDGERVRIYLLHGAEYQEVPASHVLPPLTAEQATLFLDQSKTQASTAWLKRVREWVRASSR